MKSFPGNVLIGYSMIRDDLSSSVLSEKEIKEWEQFSNERRKAEYLTARHLFRFLIQEGGFDSDVVLKKYEQGKPYAESDDTRLYVTFSHSDNTVFCGVSSLTDIGLDTELSTREIGERVLNRIMNQEEKEIFENESPVLLWTIKEAVVKCLGTGLRTNLNELTIIRKEGNEFLVRINDEKSFQICSFTALNHQISIAY